MLRSRATSRAVRTDVTAGFSLVETVLAVLLIGGALAAVLSMISTSVHQVGYQKMEAAAVGFASGQMNRILFEEEFEDVATVGFTEVTLDGTTFRYKLDVVPIDNSAIHYAFSHVVYHDPSHDPTRPGAEPTVPTLVDEDQPIMELDAKFATADQPVLKDLLLTLQWHGPGEAYRPERHLKLMSRKARL